MRLSPRLAINLGVVLLLFVVTVGWVITSVVGPQVTGGQFEVTADFAESGGVFTNQEVTYRGVLVGRVGDLELNEDGVDIELLIDGEWEGRIPADSIARIQSKSPVGEQFVNLTPGSSAGEMLEDGDAIARANTELPVDFQRLLSALDRVLADVPPEASRRVIQELAGGLRGRGDDLATILASLGTLADTFADVAPEQQRLLDNATGAGAEFLRTREAFAAALRAADQVAAGIGDEPEELRALFASNDRVARAGIRLLARRGDDFESGIGALSDIVAFQLEQRAQIEGMLEYLPGFLHAVEDASVPWRSPDGRKFYRIRVGLILDNQPSSWPCKYELPNDWERFAFQRDVRPVRTSMDCIPGEDEAAQRSVRALVRSLRSWAKSNPLPEPEAEPKAETKSAEAGLDEVPGEAPVGEAEGAETTFEEATRYFPADWTEPNP
ncbi:MAG TPA: MlaD family protein [Actinomycetota bacterium]|nr:MlaD family protein [Actinomycetota bacterium]